MLHVLIIGANLPALIMARALSHDPAVKMVRVVGSPSEARASNQLGPIYLWDSEPIREYMYDVGYLQWKDVKSIPALRKRVAWYKEKNLPGYNVKVGKAPKDTEEPCRGKSEFTVVADGFDFLGKALVNWIQESRVARLIQGLVTDLTITESGWDVHTKSDGVPASWDFDVIVNCAPRHVFERLRGHNKTEWEEIPVYFHQSLEPPKYHPQPDCLVYNGLLEYPWHRASFDFRHRCWVYETTMENAIIPGSFKVTKMGAKVPRAELPTKREPRVVHCGRWAEMKNELLISDIITNSQEYLHKITSSIKVD